MHFKPINEGGKKRRIEKWHIFFAHFISFPSERHKAAQVKTGPFLQQIVPQSDPKDGEGEGGLDKNRKKKIRKIKAKKKRPGSLQGVGGAACVYTQV